MKFDTTQELIDSFRRGEMVVLVDDDDDRLGGVLLAPAEDIGADKVNFMVPNGDVHWTCDGTPERTGCPDGTNQVVAYRADGRRFVVECRMLQ